MSGLWDEDLFDAFLANRLEIVKKPINTERAVKSLRKKLIEWHNIGYNINAILQHAIDVGWRGLFIPTGMEPRQSHLKPSGKLSTMVDQVSRKHRMPRGKTQVELHDQANGVRAAGKHALAMKEMNKLLGK